nr:MAG TPA: hypothetical protein [Caudoviricetes sp.]
MKRKEAVQFLDAVARYINKLDGTIAVVNGKTGEQIRIDTDLALIFLGTPVLAVRDILASDELDEITPERFVLATAETACKAYVQQLEQR